MSADGPLSRVRCEKVGHEENLEPQRRNRNIVHIRIIRLSALAAGLVAFSVLASACERASPPVDATAHSVVADIIVSVSNQTARRMQIFLKGGATEHPLGVVAERSSRSFSLPSGLGESAGALRFEAREPRASTGIHSDAFSVSPGQQVLWAFDERGSRAVTTR